MTGEPIRSVPTLDLRPLAKEKPMLDPSDPSNAAVKPAYKSTEFWLTLIATVIGFLLTSGILDAKDDSQAKVIQGLVAISGILAALGYAGLRTSAKNKATEGATMIAVAKAAPLAIDLLKSAGVSDPTKPAAGP